MAKIINQPRLEIEIIDDTWALMKAEFDIDWNANPFDDFHRIYVEVWGDDSPLRDDRLSAADYLTPTFYRLRGGLFTITGTQRVQRALLDEDKPWGVISSLRRQRDIDEIYVVGFLEVRASRRDPAGTRIDWTQLGNKSSKSNIVKERF